MFGEAQMSRFGRFGQVRFGSTSPVYGCSVRSASLGSGPNEPRPNVKLHRLGGCAVESNMMAVVALGAPRP